MIEYYINIAYTRSYISLTRVKNEERDLSLQTEAIAFLMLAAGIHRIMDKPACYEFLSRIAILLKHQDIVDNFFKDDTLFIIHGKGYKYKVTMDNIDQHLGIEISNSPDDLIPRKSWLKNIKKHWKTACVVAVINENPMLEKKQIGENVYEIGARPEKEITKEYLHIVDLFAREAIKSIPEESFENLRFRVTKVHQNIAEYRAELKKKPRYKFDYAEISDDIKEEIFNACFDQIKDKKDMLIEPMFISLVYLAWLWANNHVRVYQVELGDKKGYTADVDPRMPFNYEDFDGLNSMEFGINIYDTFHDFNLDKIVHLLKEKK